MCTNNTAPDPWGPKTYGSYRSGSGSGTLVRRRLISSASDGKNPTGLSAYQTLGNDADHLVAVDELKNFPRALSMISFIVCLASSFVCAVGENKFFGSVTFRYGYTPLTNGSWFGSESFLLTTYYFVNLHLHYYSKHTEITKQKKSRFFVLFLLMMEGFGSGDGSVPRNNGSGRPPKLNGILWIGIRNTVQGNQVIHKIPGGVWLVPSASLTIESSAAKSSWQPVPWIGLPGSARPAPWEALHPDGLEQGTGCFLFLFSERRLRRSKEELPLELLLSTSNFSTSS
jgi:hypothetical protein